MQNLKTRNLAQPTVRQGFTLIELLIVIAIIGVLISLSIFATADARKSGRDGRRKADLELIRSGLELFRADCNLYPGSITFGGQLKGDNSVSSCSTSNIYINSVPKDPLDSTRTYSYSSVDGITYTLCASLEKLSGTCNYTVINP